MKRIATLFAAIVVLAPLTASADPLAFGTVTKINRYFVNGVQITGVPVGSNVAQTVSVGESDTQISDSCERAAYLVLTHPGRYVIEIGHTCTVRTAS